jgi:ABC-type multidrug transport system ATPase subunit
MVRLRAIANQKRIVIVITHTPDRVADLFDKVVVLAKNSEHVGRLAYYGSIADAKAFFGRNTMEEIVRAVNGKNEGGDGLADSFIQKYDEQCKEKAAKA